MIPHPPSEQRPGKFWLLLLGFAGAAIFTLGAAVMTSMLHGQNPEQTKSFEVPVAQR
jgi:hypothetical protein